MNPFSRKRLLSQPTDTPGPSSKRKLEPDVRNAVKTSLTVLKECFDGVPAPGVKGAVGGLLQLMEIVENVKGNEEDVARVVDRINELQRQVVQLPESTQSNVPEPLRYRPDDLQHDLEKLLKETQSMQGRSKMARAANHSAYKNAVQHLNTELDRLLAHISATGSLRLEAGVASILHNFLEILDEGLISALPRAQARCDSHSSRPSRPCFRDTRVGLLQVLRKWIKAEGDVADEEIDTPLFWLCGEVGVGKTTVAHTIAKEQDEEGQLGASFFFSRYDDLCCDPTHLFPTIAYQLARFDPVFYTAIAKALRLDPDIVRLSLKEQLEQLITTPLKRSSIDSSRTVLLVIDGLDECSEPESLLKALSGGNLQGIGFRLRILLTSRPHSAIRTTFNRRLAHLTTQFDFRNIDRTVLESDVASYLRWHLGEIAAEFDLTSPWPLPKELEELIKRANGLFIIGSLYVKYIGNLEEGDPVGQLSRVLSRSRPVGASPLEELDAVYRQVVADLRRFLKTDWDMELTRNVIELVVLSQEPPTEEVVAGLLSADIKDVRSILRRLTSVIALPNLPRLNYGFPSPIAFGRTAPFHASFGEFMQDPGRCTDSSLLVQPKEAHDRIATYCIASTISVETHQLFHGVVPHARYAFNWIGEHISLARKPSKAVSTIDKSKIWSDFLLARGREWASNILNFCSEAQWEQSPHATYCDLWVLARKSRHGYGASPLGSNVIHVDPGNKMESAIQLAQQLVFWTRIENPEVPSISSWKWIPLESTSASLCFNTDVTSSMTVVEYLASADPSRTSKLELALKLCKGIQSFWERLTESETDPASRLRTGLTEHPILIDADHILISREGNVIIWAPGWNLPRRDGSPKQGSESSKPESRTTGRTGCPTYTIDYSNDHQTWTSDDACERAYAVGADMVWRFGTMLYLLVTGVILQFECLDLSYCLRTHSFPNGKARGCEIPTGNNAMSDDRHPRIVYVKCKELQTVIEAFDGDEDIQRLLQDCWALRRSARPSLSDCVKRLAAIIESRSQTP